MMQLVVIAEAPYCDFAVGFLKKAGRRLDRGVFGELCRRFDGVTWYMQAILWVSCHGSRRSAGAAVPFGFTKFSFALFVIACGAFGML